MKKTTPMWVATGWLLVVWAVGAADWPAFRGGTGGVAADKDLPVTWTKDNFLWKVKLPGPGTSSPITVGDKIFLTSYTGYGETITKGFSGGFGGGGGGKSKGGGDTGGDQKKLRLVVLCLDRNKGDVVWKKEVEPKLPESSFSGFLREHGYASSTPVSDGERVYVFFGKTGVLAFDLQGKQLWHESVGTNKHFWGSASSPVIHKDLVIVNAAVESGSLVALDRMTGKEKWRVKGVGACWTSPILVKTKDDKIELVLNQPSKVAGYHPETGEKLWECEGIGSGGGKGGKGGGGKGGKGGGGGFGGMGGGYTASTPVAKDGIVYIIGGGGPTPAQALAIKTGGKGDVTKTHILWKAKAGSTNCSPVLVGDQLCWVSGNVTALNIEDGKTTANERLYGNRQEYVSAVAAGDKIFALTRYEGLYVLDSAKFEQLAHNEFANDKSIFNASPAVSDGRLYIRSNEYLYCIGKK